MIKIDIIIMNDKGKKKRKNDKKSHKRPRKKKIYQMLKKKSHSGIKNEKKRSLSRPVIIANTSSS